MANSIDLTFVNFGDREQRPDAFFRARPSLFSLFMIRLLGLGQGVDLRRGLRFHLDDEIHCSLHFFVRHNLLLSSCKRELQRHCNISVARSRSNLGRKANARSVSAAGIRLSATNCFESLEGKLRPQLNSARIANGGYLTIRGGSDGGANSPKVRVIEYIEHFTTKLQPRLLTEPNVLEQREIESLCRWPINYSTACIADGVRNRWCCWIELQARCIEIL